MWFVCVCQLRPGRVVKNKTKIKITKRKIRFATGKGGGGEGADRLRPGPLAAAPVITELFLNSEDHELLGTQLPAGK